MKQILNTMFALALVVLAGVLILGQVGKTLDPTPQVVAPVTGQTGQSAAPVEQEPDGVDPVLFFSFGLGVLLLGGTILAVVVVVLLRARNRGDEKTMLYYDAQAQPVRRTPPEGRQKQGRKR